MTPANGPLSGSGSVADRLRATTWRALIAIRAFLLRHLPSESQHVFAVTLATGVVCGFLAVAFHLAIRMGEHLLIDRAMRAHGPAFVWWTLLTPTLGGLLSGIILTFVVPGARGSGIPQVKQAYELSDGRIRFRDAVGKFFIGAFQIGSGASLGREGPTVQICAGAATMVARAAWLPLRSRKRLIPVGVAAGIAAAFNAPIAAVTFTIEEIVGALDQTVLSGVVVAAALAAVIERSVLGVNPVIHVEANYGLSHPSSLLIYALLGVAAGAVSIVFADGLLRLRAGFRRLTTLPSWAHPAVGGLVTGALAVIVFRFLHVHGVTGGGYETLGLALAGKLTLKALLVLCVVKVVATVFSYSSGGAGGIFAPSLFVGAMLGGAFGFVDVTALGHEPDELGAFALVGMGAVFAGVIRAPITSVLIIFEMTGGYGLVLPLMIANTSAYVLARRFRQVPIYEAFLEQDGILLPHRIAKEHPSEQLVAVTPARTPSIPDWSPSDAALRAHVRDLSSRVEPVAAATNLDDLVARLLTSKDGALAVRLGESGACGVVLTDYVRELFADAQLKTMLIAADIAIRAPAIPGDAELDAAVALMNEHGVDALPVVDTPAGEVVGIVTRSAIGRFVFDRYLLGHRGAPQPSVARG